MIQENHKCIRRNVKGDQLHSLSMLKRAIVKAYLIKAWEIDQPIQSCFIKLHSDRTFQKILKLVNSVSLNRLKPQRSDFEKLLNFLQQRSSIRSLRLDLLNIIKHPLSISNSEMLAFLVAKISKRGFLKRLKKFHVNFCDVELNCHLQRKLYHCLTFFKELNSYKFKIDTQEPYSPDLSSTINLYNNLRYLRDLQSLSFDLTTLNNLEVCEAVGKRLLKFSSLEKIEISGFLNDNFNKNSEAFILLLSHISKLKNIKFLNISTFDYSKSKSYDKVIVSIENLIQRLSNLEVLDLKADFTAKRSQLMSLWDTLGLHDRLTTLKFSFLAQQMNSALIQHISQNLSKLSKLQILSLIFVGPEVSFTEYDMGQFAKGISSIHKLTHLKLYFPPSSKSKYDSFFEKMGQLPALTTFKFSGDQKPEKIIKFIGKHPNVESLKLILKNLAKVQLNNLDELKNITYLRKFCLRADGIEQEAKFLISLLRHFKQLEKCEIRNKGLTIRKEDWMDVLESFVKAEKLEKLSFHASFYGFGQEIHKAVPFLGYTSRFKHLSVTAFVEDAPPTTFQFSDPDLWFY